MKKQHTEILLSLVRRMASITAHEKDRIRRKTRSTRHPLGQRMFRGKMRIWPAERLQMAYVVELREAGKTWDEVYFQFLRERRRNLRNGREISRGRLQNMYAAELEFRERATWHISSRLLYWHHQGYSLESIAALADLDGLIPSDSKSLEEIREMISAEEQLQDSEMRRYGLSRIRQSTNGRTHGGEFINHDS